MSTPIPHNPFDVYTPRVHFTIPEEPTPMQIDTGPYQVRQTTTDPTFKATLYPITVVSFDRNSPEITRALTAAASMASSGVQSWEDALRIQRNSIGRLNEVIKETVIGTTAFVETRMLVQEVLYIISQYSVNEHVKQVIYDHILNHERSKWRSFRHAKLA